MNEIYQIYNNYIQQRLLEELPDFKKIPSTVLPTNFYTILFSGWESIRLDENDQSCRELLELGHVNISHIVLSKKDTHAFSMPEFIWRPYELTAAIRIGAMELEMYEQIMEKKNNLTSSE